MATQVALSTTLLARTPAEALDLDPAKLPALIKAAAPGPPAYDDVTLRAFANTLTLVSGATLLRMSLLFGQIMKETAWLRFGNQVAPAQYNLAGLGATNDGAAGMWLRSIVEGVQAVAAHHFFYILGDVANWPALARPFAVLDQRGPKVLASPFGGKVRVIGDYVNGAWAYTEKYPDGRPMPVGTLDNGYAAGIVALANRALAAAPATGVRPIVTPKIALTSGHLNSDGGDPYEKTQTAKLTQAVASWCGRMGMDVRVVQPDGPDADNLPGDGMYGGGLQSAARVVLGWAKAGWVPDVFLESHTEGGGGIGGFAIYPDAPGDLDTDVRDRLGPLMARKFAAYTGLSIGAWGTGVMSEKSTGVGGGGDRLGIFLATDASPMKETTARLIFEYGAHDKDPDLTASRAPAFYDQSGRATAEAIAEFLGWTPPVVVGTVTDVTNKDKPIVENWTDAITGHTIAPEFRGVYDFAQHGRPRSPAYTNSDGILRQLFDNVLLENAATGPKLGGLGIAYEYKAGSPYVDFPNVHPYV